MKKRRQSYQTGRLTAKGQKFFDLLKGGGDGVVTYRVIEAVLFPRGKEPRGPRDYGFYASHVRVATGLGVVHHIGVGFRLEPELDVEARK